MIRPSIAAALALCVAIPASAFEADEYFFRVPLTGVATSGGAVPPPGGGNDAPPGMGENFPPDMGENNPPPSEPEAPGELGVALATQTAAPAGSRSVFAAEASNAVSGASFTLIGTVPTGMNFSSLGVLSGYPVAGSYGPFVIRVEDGLDRVAETDPFSFTVEPTEGAKVWAETPILYRTNTSKTIQLSFDGFGGTPTWTHSTLPTGVSRSNSTLVGRPTTAGIYNVAVTGTRNGLVDTFSILMDSALALSAIVPPEQSVRVRVGETLEATPTGNNLRGPGRWRINLGTLPSDLAIDPENGRLSGAATGTWQATVRYGLTDLTDNVTVNSGSFEVRSAEPLALQPIADVSTVFGLFTRINPVAQNRIGVGTWSLAEGTLPTGMSVAANGNVEGNPSQEGTFSGLRLRLVDAWDGSVAVSAPFSITVTGAPIADMFPSQLLHMTRGVDQNSNWRDLYDNNDVSRLFVDDFGQSYIEMVFDQPVTSNFVRIRHRRTTTGTLEARWQYFNDVTGAWTTIVTIGRSHGSGSAEYADMNQNYAPITASRWRLAGPMCGSSCSRKAGEYPELRPGFDGVTPVYTAP